MHVDPIYGRYRRLILLLFDTLSNKQFHLSATSRKGGGGVGGFEAKRGLPVGCKVHSKNFLDMTIQNHRSSTCSQIPYSPNRIKSSSNVHQSSVFNPQPLFKIQIRGKKRKKKKKKKTDPEAINAPSSWQPKAYTSLL